MLKLLCLGLAVVFLLDKQSEASSLMKRIREKQNSDDADNRGLDFETDDWIHVPQPIQDVLMSIDDKLRSLDTFSYTLKLARLDFSLDQLARRMENIETKLGRLETKFDVRMEKVEEVVISKDIKEEFSNEHLSRRMESLNEKINNKAAYLDAKLDVKLERIMSKLEILQRDLHGATEDILERLVKNEERQSDFEKEIRNKNENVDELLVQFQDIRLFIKEDLTNSLNNGFGNIKSQMDDGQAEFREDMDMIATTCKDLTTIINESITECLEIPDNKIGRLASKCGNGTQVRSYRGVPREFEVLTTHLLTNLTTKIDKMQRVGDDKYRKLESDLDRNSRKVVNLLEDIWKSTNLLETDLEKVSKSGNLTREAIAKETIKLNELVESVSLIRTETSSFKDSMDRKIEEFQNSLDDNFSTLLLAQNSFMASCSRIQEEEIHVFDILQQIVYEIRNRSVEDFAKIMSQLETQCTNRSLATPVVWIDINSSSVIFQNQQKDHGLFKHSFKDSGKKGNDFICRPVTSLSQKELGDILGNTLVSDADKVSDKNVNNLMNNEVEDFSHETTDKSRDNGTSKLDDNIDQGVKRLGYDDFIKD